MDSAPHQPYLPRARALFGDAGPACILYFRVALYGSIIYSPPRSPVPGVALHLAGPLPHRAARYAIPFVAATLAFFLAQLRVHFYFITSFPGSAQFLIGMGTGTGFMPVIFHQRISLGRVEDDLQARSASRHAIHRCSVLCARLGIVTGEFPPREIQVRRALIFIIATRDPPHPDMMTQCVLRDR